MPPRPALALFLLSVALLPPVHAQETSPYPPPPGVPLSADALADFAWFSTLGFPDVKDKPFGSYHPGLGQSVVNPTDVYGDIQGFLLSQTNDNSTVLTLTLAQTTFNSADPAGPGNLKMGPFKSLSLNTTATAVAQSLVNPPSPAPTPDPITGLPRSPYSRYLSRRTQVFILAWACWRNDLPALAAHLYESAQKLPDPAHPTAPIPDFHAVLQSDLGDLAFATCLETLRDPSPGFTRSTFVAQLQTLLKNYPLCDQAPLVQHIITSFQETIAEDAAHAVISASDLAKLPLDQRIAELIYQLRNVTGGGDFYSQGNLGPMWGNPFLTRDLYNHPPSGHPEVPPSAADQLFDLGLPAVPQLIAALNDITYTRNAVMGGFAGNNTIQHVGQCAAEILGAIAGRSFCPPDSSPFWDGTWQLVRTDAEAVPPSVQQAIVAWWTAVQTQGEKQILINGVAAGDRNSWRQAPILLQKYPAAAAPAILLGIANTTTAGLRPDSPEFMEKSNVHDALIDELILSDDPRTIAYLLNLFLHSSDIFTRTRYAPSLIRHGHPEIVPIMIQEWHTQVAQPHPDRGSRLTTILDFLAQSNSPDAITTIALDLPKFSPTRRTMIMGSLVHGLGGGGVYGDDHWPVSPATRAAYEKLFVGELSDTAPCPLMSDYMRSANSRVQIQSPRLSDFAAYALAANFPAQYQFDLSAPPAARDAQIAAIQATYSKTHPNTPPPTAQPPPSPTAPPPAS
jgi:hypothetical protein